MAEQTNPAAAEEQNQESSEGQEPKGTYTEPDKPEPLAPAEITAEGAAVYEERRGTVEAIQFDGKNQDALIELVGKDHAKKYGDDQLEIRTAGAHVSSPKQYISAGQWLVHQAIGSIVAVINDGEFRARYKKTDEELSQNAPQETTPREQTGAPQPSAW